MKPPTLRSNGSPLRCLALTLCALAVSACGTSAQGDAPRYNIVVIMADDLDVASLDRMLALNLMPHLRQHFVNEGIRFTNAFVTNSLCCPSRATFATGQYSHNHGVLTNSPPAGSLGAFRAESTLPVWLSAAGYRTSHIGKFLNGYGRLLPADYVPGTDRCAAVEGEPIAQTRYIPPGWHDWYGLLDYDYSTYRMYDMWVNDNCTIRFEARRPDDPTDLRRDGYQTDLLAWRAVKFLQEANAARTPFFLEIMPLAPHLEIFPGATRFEPYQELWKWDIRPAPRHAGSVAAWPPIAPAMNEDLGDKPAWMQPGMRRERPPLTLTDYAYLTRQYRHRLESLRAIDDLIGTVAATLRANGQLSNTVMVFTSDNGFQHGEHNLSEKEVAYEESIRVPLLMRMPDGRGGRTVDALVINNDLAPTIVALAGAVPGLTMDGTSFVALLSGGVPEWRKRFLVEHWDSDALDIPAYSAVRVKTASPDGRSADLLYLEYRNPDVDGLWNTPEFYDLAIDPYQCESQHAIPAPLRIAQRQALHTTLAALNTCAGERCQQLEFCPGPFDFCRTAEAMVDVATPASQWQRIGACAKAAAVP